MSSRLHTIVGWVLGFGALTFVLLLAGFGSGALTDDPPAVSPYATPGDVSTTTTTQAAASSTAPSTTQGAEAETAVLQISGFAFGDPISVATGTEVTITNQDGAPHTWTSRDGLWDSGSLSGGDTFAFTFTEPGTFEFFCSIHSSMTGSITVTG